MLPGYTNGAPKQEIYLKDLNISLTFPYPEECIIESLNLKLFFYFT